MEANVLENEPHLALFVPDDDPLLFYRAIARFGQRHLVEGGHLYFEINALCGKETVAMLRARELHRSRINTRSYTGKTVS